jgi:hypothetical protein
LGAVDLAAFFFLGGLLAFLTAAFAVFFCAASSFFVSLASLSSGLGGLLLDLRMAGLGLFFHLSVRALAPRDLLRSAYDFLCLIYAKSARASWKVPG